VRVLSGESSLYKQRHISGGRKKPSLLIPDHRADKDEPAHCKSGWCAYAVQVSANSSQTAANIQTNHSGDNASAIGNVSNMGTPGKVAPYGGMSVVFNG